MSLRGNRFHDGKCPALSLEGHAIYVGFLSLVANQDITHGAFARCWCVSSKPWEKIRMIRTFRLKLKNTLGRQKQILEIRNLCDRYLAGRLSK